MHIEIRIEWDDEAHVWRASSSGDFGLLIENASLKVLKTIIPEIAADLASLPVGDLKITILEGNHPSGYQFDSEQDRLRWEDTKQFLDDGWEGPTGEFSLTDLKRVR